ncbi:MAG: GldG family protein [Bryobacteraceae bacterium]
MASGILQAKQTRFGAYVAVYTAVILAALTIANFLANRHNKSYDSTANKRFSLSDQTAKVIKGLTQDVKIQYFDRTQNFANPGGAKDLLDQYDNLSSRVSVEYVDPEKKPQLARSEGVRNFGTTFVRVGEKKEEAKSVTEEELTGALIRALKGGQRMACAIKGSGERAFSDSDRSGVSGLKEYLERNNYKTQELSLVEKAEIPKDCTVLMVAGPKRDYLPPAVDAIQKFVEGGGRALFLLDPPVKFAKDETDENAALTKLIEGWGVTVNKDLVLDLSPVGQVFGLGPEMPLVTSYENHAIVREMRETAAAMPLVRSLEVKSGGKTTVDKLFSSSANSYATTRISSPEIRLDQSKDKKGPHVLAAAGSYNTGKEKEQGRFVVVGTSGFASNNFLRFGGNRDLVMNMFNWLSQDEDLISIRPKEPEDRRLSLNARQMRMILFYSLGVLPLAFLAMGLSVWWKRR